ADRRLPGRGRLHQSRDAGASRSDGRGPPGLSLGRNPIRQLPALATRSTTTMRLQRLRDRLNNERGNVLLFTFTLLVFLLVMGGFAIDFAYQAAARTELQRTIDAAALAGAGKLVFDDTVFPTVRSTAQLYGTRNSLRTGALTLNLNTANAANGDIVLGIWNAGTFTPSLVGNQVNAVRCQVQTTIPTSVLRLLYIGTLPITTSAVATSNPPVLPGCETPILPIAVT